MGAIGRMVSVWQTSFPQPIKRCHSSPAACPADAWVLACRPGAGIFSRMAANRFRAAPTSGSSESVTFLYPFSFRQSPQSNNCPLPSSSQRLSRSIRLFPRYEKIHSRPVYG